MLVERLFDPLLKSPVDVILPQDNELVVMELVPFEIVPDEVIAPHINALVPQLTVPDKAPPVLS